MSIEIEKKYRLAPEQRIDITARLKDSKADFAGTDHEINELYGGGILEEKRAVLRVRKIEGKTILTYKRRIKNDSPVKHQIEHETEIGNAAEIEQIIENLGFEKRLVYEKRRETWHLGKAEIVLDELPFGLYMEIEGAAEEIGRIEQILDAGAFPVEHATYPELTVQLGSRKAGIIEARFTEKS